MHAVSDLPNLEIGKLGRRLAVLDFLQEQKRLKIFIFYQLQNGIKNYLKSIPASPIEFSLKHLSSYLGTTQVSLSRIRGGKQ
jgi:hypothetical protein